MSPMKPKILLISTTTAYPLYSGGALAQYYFIDGLKDKVDYSFCTVIKSKRDLDNLNALKVAQPSLKVYYSDEYIVVKKSKFSFLKSICNKFLPKKSSVFTSAEPDDFSDSYFTHVDHAFSHDFIDLINSVIEKEKIEIVQFDFYDTIDIVFALPSNVKKVFVHHEVREKRLNLAKNKSAVSEANKNYLIGKTTAFEYGCLPYMDVVGVFNDDDAKELMPYCKKVMVTPFAIPDELIYKSSDSDVFDRLFFVGGEGHTPNALGLKWFLDNIYIPNYDKIKLPLLVIGNWSQSFKVQYANTSGVHFCGQVDSMQPYFEHSIFVNPILTGAGLRTKVLHAFANRVPVLSTRFGAEGCFESEKDDHLGLFDNAEEFLDVLVSSNYKKLSGNGYEYYNYKYGKEILLTKRLSLYNA